MRSWFLFLFCFFFIKKKEFGWKILTTRVSFVNYIHYVSRLLRNFTINLQCQKNCKAKQKRNNLTNNITSLDLGFDKNRCPWRVARVFDVPLGKHIVATVVELFHRWLMWKHSLSYAPATYKERNRLSRGPLCLVCVDRIVDIGFHNAESRLSMEVWFIRLLAGTFHCAVPTAKKTLTSFG